MGASLIGSWISTVAIGWLTYRLTNSELLLGVVGFAGQIPFFMLIPFSGVIVDCTDKRRLLVGAQAGSMILSLILAVLALSDALDIWGIVIVSALRGVINSLDMPARHALVIQLVEDREDVPNAIALNSAMFNASRLLGPAIGGVLLAASSEGTCFLVDAVSYLPAIMALWLLKLKGDAVPRGRVRLLQELGTGLRYVAAHTIIFRLLLCVALSSIFGSSYMALLPVFAKKVFQGGPELLGLLMAFSGLGALLGALHLAGRGVLAGIGRAIFVAAVWSGCGMLGLAVVPLAWGAFCAMFCIGAAMITFLAASNTVLQTLVEDDKRGRVMSLYGLCMVGMMPFGSLLGGVAAHLMSAQIAVGICGVVCLAVACLFAPMLCSIDRDPLISGGEISDIPEDPR